MDDFRRKLRQLKTCQCLLFSPPHDQRKRKKKSWNSSSWPITPEGETVFYVLVTYLASTTCGSKINHSHTHACHQKEITQASTHVVGTHCRFKLPAISLNEQRKMGGERRRQAWAGELLDVQVWMTTRQLTGCCDRKTDTEPTVRSACKRPLRP